MRPTSLAVPVAPIRPLLWLSALLIVIALRFNAAEARGRVQLVTLPAGVPAMSGRLANHALAEREIAVNGSRLLEQSGVVPRGFVKLLAAAYDRLEAAEGALPSPLPATYLGMQRPERFDTLVVDPLSRPRCNAGAVVFLHGYAGNVGLVCWLVSQAASAHGLTTYCPSVGSRGDWWTRAGARTLAATLRHVRGRGVGRIYLVGLSNGAAGASVLAPRFRRKLAGLILISGLSPRAGPPGLPTLLIHGRRDPAVPPARARRYLQRTGRRAQQVTLAGDHYVLLTREVRVRAALSRWLGRRERRSCRR